MMLVGMLFVLLVLGPVVILGLMALASDERTMARLRRLLPRSTAKDAAPSDMPAEPGDHAAMV